MADHGGLPGRAGREPREGPRLRPLALAAVGLGAVFLDPRVGAAQVDVLPDVLGWLLVVHATRRLGDDDKAAQLTLWTSLATTVLSLADLVRVPYVSLVYDLAVGAALMLFFTYLAVLAARAQDDAASALWLRLRTAVLVLTAAGVFLGLVGRGGAGGPVLVLFVLAALATLAVSIGMLLAHSARPWAQPGAGNRPHG